MKVSEIAIKNQKKRRNADKFSALLKTPATGQFKIPANCRGRLYAKQNINSISTGITVNGKQIRVPVMTTGKYSPINLSAGSVVSLASVCDLFVDVGLGVFKKIGGP